MLPALPFRTTWVYNLRNLYFRKRDDFESLAVTPSTPAHTGTSVPDPRSCGMLYIRVSSIQLRTSYFHTAQCPCLSVILIIVYLIHLFLFELIKSKNRYHFRLIHNCKQAWRVSYFIWHFTISPFKNLCYLFQNNCFHLFHVYMFTKKPSSGIH